MSYTVEITTTKPAGVEFFGPANPGVDGRSRILADQASGFVSKDVVKLDANTIVKTLVFTTEESFREYDSRVKASTAPGYLQKKQYNSANNIVSTRRVIS